MVSCALKGWFGGLHGSLLRCLGRRWGPNRVVWRDLRGPVFGVYGVLGVQKGGFEGSRGSLLRCLGCFRGPRVVLRVPEGPVFGV